MKFIVCAFLAQKVSQISVGFQQELRLNAIPVACAPEETVETVMPKVTQWAQLTYGLDETWQITVSVAEITEGTIVTLS